jgi:hypothetical protein
MFMYYAKIVPTSYVYLRGQVSCYCFFDASCLVPAQPSAVVMSVLLVVFATARR